MWAWAHAVGTALVVLLALGPLACGGGSHQTPAPQSLTETLAQFLSAVQASDFHQMGALWGTERGPATDWMKAEDLRQRLTVIQKYLNHVGYRVVDGPSAVPGNENERNFHVEIQRPTGCKVVLPIDLVHVKSGGWLVHDVHLDVAGSPVASCRP